MDQRTGPRIISGHRAGLLAIAAAAAGWASAAVVARALFEDGVPPLHLAGARAIVAAAALLVLGRLRGAPLRGWRSLIPLGAAIALVNAAYYLAIERLAVAIAIVLQYTAPVIVVASVAVAGRRWPRREILVALLLAVGGVALVSLTGGTSGPLDPLGVAIGLAGAALFALYTMLSEGAARRHGAVGALRGAFCVAAVFWVVVLAPVGVPSAMLEPRNLLLTIFVGLSGTLAPFLLYVWGTRRVRAERATIAATLEPPLAAAAAWLWLDQRLTPLQITGGALVLLAVVLLQIRSADPPRIPEL